MEQSWNNHPKNVQTHERLGQDEMVWEDEVEQSWYYHATNKKILWSLTLEKNQFQPSVVNGIKKISVALETKSRAFTFYTLLCNFKIWKMIQVTCGLKYLQKLKISSHNEDSWPQPELYPMTTQVKWRPTSWLKRQKVKVKKQKATNDCTIAR